MTNVRPGLQTLHTFPRGEEVLDMIVHDGRVMVATTCGIYEVRSGAVCPLPLVPYPAELAIILAGPDNNQRATSAPKPKTPKKKPAPKAAAAAPEITWTPPALMEREPGRAETIPPEARSAMRRGWRVVQRGRAVTAGSERKIFGGVDMWRPRQASKKGGA